MKWQLLLTKTDIGRKSYLSKLKTFKSILLLLLIFLTLHLYGDCQEHIVKTGENLSQIAKLYNVNVADILSVNGIIDANKIWVGQKLLIPNNRLVIKLDEVSATTNAVSNVSDIEQSGTHQSYLQLTYSSSPSGYSGEEHIYRVKTGDTVSAIAKAYNVKEEHILSRNGLAESKLEAGQILFIPTDSFGFVFTIDKEVELLARVIAAEARGEIFEGQIAVGAVILNRVKDPRFPDSISEVVFEKGQFQVVSNGMYLSVVVPELCRRAATEALRGRDPTGGALFFYNPRIAQNPSFHEQRIRAIEIGNHLFTY